MQNEADLVQNHDIESLTSTMKSLSSLVGEINSIQGQHTESLIQMKEVQDGLVNLQAEHSSAIEAAGKKIGANVAAIG